MPRRIIWVCCSRGTYCGCCQARIMAPKCWNWATQLLVSGTCRNEIKLRLDFWYLIFFLCNKSACRWISSSLAMFRGLSAEMFGSSMKGGLSVQELAFWCHVWSFLEWPPSCPCPCLRMAHPISYAIIKAKHLYNLPMFVIVILIATVYSIQIPVNFSIDPHSNKKYDIRYDFNDTKTYYPVKANVLSLGKVNLSIEMLPH